MDCGKRLNGSKKKCGCTGTYLTLFLAKFVIFLLIEVADLTHSAVGWKHIRNNLYSCLIELPA